MTARTQLAGNSGVTRYLQLYTLLAQQLADGRIVPGSALPSEPELVRQYRVSRTTVRRALDRLEKEARIVRRRGSGTYARKVKTPRPVRVRMNQLLADVRALSEGTRMQLVRFERIPTPDFLRELAPDFGDTALLVQRTRGVGNEPMLVGTSYVPENIGHRLRKRDLGNKALLLVLRELGGRPTHCERLFSATSADASLAQALKVPVGAPLMLVRQTVRDARKRIIEYSEICYRAERCEFHAETALR